MKDFDFFFNEVGLIWSKCLEELLMFPVSLWTVSDSFCLLLWPKAALFFFDTTVLISLCSTVCMSRCGRPITLLLFGSFLFQSQRYRLPL